MKTDGIGNKEVSNSLVMVVDDEPDMLNMLHLVLTKKCQCQVIKAGSGRQALELLDTHHPEIIISDIKMPDLDGLELLKRIRQFDKTISVVLMTGYGTIDMAVQALKDGAYDFIQKPFDKDHITRIIANCLERTMLLRANRTLREQLDNLSPEGIIGQSPALKQALDLISRVADTDATVLIRGESGTGKELAARALHNLSNRRNLPMVTVNCPALPENILESELFGYAKGAFTGALTPKKGLFMEADGSTILLDEIADIPISIQTKLLRVLQEKEIQPLGQNRTVKVDARVVASTNQDLETKIREGTFREDLFYRLNVVTITMPNLKEMLDDVPLLINYYLSQFKKQYDREKLTISPEVLHYLGRRDWPGNIRELRNTIKRIVLLSSNNRVEMSDLDTPKPGGSLCSEEHSVEQLFDKPYNEAKQEIIRRFSIDYLKKALGAHGGNVTNAAAASGLERQGLQRIMRRYGISSVDFKSRKT